jgi:hypothetical protein
LQVDKAGTIWWRGDNVTTFHQRYLVLTKRVLQVYPSQEAFEGDEPCSGFFSLSRLEIEPDAGTTSKGHQFVVRNAGIQVDIACSCKEERADWLENLQSAVHRVKTDEQSAPFIVVDQIPLHEIMSVALVEEEEDDSPAATRGGKSLLGFDFLHNRGAEVTVPGDIILTIQTVPGGYNSGRSYAHRCAGPEAHAWLLDLRKAVKTAQLVEAKRWIAEKHGGSRLPLLRAKALLIHESVSFQSLVSLLVMFGFCADVMEAQV